jgi:magnesium transporter
MLRTRLYRDGVLLVEGFRMTEVSGHLREPDTVVWVDLCEPRPQDLARLGRELQLHDLAVEDATQVHERPKLNRYSTHLFLTA